MIIVTAGTMLPFDRLIRAMDQWAEQHPAEETFAQIGNGSYKPQNMRWARFVAPSEFTARVRRSSLIVAHAGTGSFLLAAETKKPVVLLPRLAVKHEHTTDHQVATARWLSQKVGVYIAMTEDELPAAVAEAQAQHNVVGSRLEPYAPEAFLAKIRLFLVE